METIRFGVIGVGMMGSEHLRNIAALPGATVAAVSDPHEQSLEWARLTVDETLGNDHPVEQFRDHRDLLGSGSVDAVIVASPNHTHASVLADIFGTRLPVMVEKPMCTTIEDCFAVVGAAEAHPAPVWVGLEYRYMPPVARFLHELRSGAAGRLRMLSIREHRFPFLPKVGSWNRFNRNTGGTLVEKCCHFFDLMNLAVGARPVRVYASGAQDVNHLDESYDGEPPDILDNAYVVVDYADGSRAALDLCMFAEASRNEQELCAVGDTGKVEAFVPEGVVVVGERSTRSVRTIDASTDPEVRYAGFHHGASYIELARFCDVLRSGGPVEVGVSDGLWSVAVGVAAHRSIDEGRPVTLAELGLGADRG